MSRTGLWPSHRDNTERGLSESIHTFFPNSCRLQFGQLFSDLRRDHLKIGVPRGLFGIQDIQPITYGSPELFHCDISIWGSVGFGAALVETTIMSWSRDVRFDSLFLFLSTFASRRPRPSPKQNDRHLPFLSRQLHPIVTLQNRNNNGHIPSQPREFP